MSIKRRPRQVLQLGPNNFTRWIQPTSMRKHLIACCDCGLTHAFQFRVVIDAKGKARIQYRARRAPR
jgi:hypothetical protein